LRACKSRLGAADEIAVAESKARRLESYFSGDLPGSPGLESRRDPVILSNTESIPGKQIVQFFGVVSGSTVRAKHIGRDLMAGLKNIVGGELKGYTELLHEAREDALARMQQQAESLGANAVVNVRFSTSSVAQGAAELFAYGTAVRVE
jgi:uncharacterized protein YbjQ (UPF0145 family)